MKKNDFPSEVFPHELQKFAEQVSYTFRVSIDVVYSYLLGVTGYAMLNRYEFYYTIGWVDRPNLWMIFVGPSGTSKTPMMNALSRPITKKDAEVREYNNMEMSKYIRYRDARKRGGELYPVVSDKEMDGKEKVEEYVRWCEENLGQSMLPQDEPPKFTVVLGGGTFESFNKILSTNGNNGRSLLIRTDEFGGLTKSFNQYHKGNDEEQFLTYFDYEGNNITRIDDTKNIIIKEKNISVLGNTQPKSLFDIVSESRMDNGLIYRFLFCIDNDTIIRNIFGNRTKKNIYEEYNKMMAHFLEGYELTPKRLELIMPDEIDEYIADWEKGLWKRFQKGEFKLDLEEFGSTVSKMRYYLFRFAIIVNRLRKYYENDQDDLNFVLEDFQNAIKVVEFFIRNTEYVINHIVFTKNRFFKNQEESDFYDNLPDNGFTRKEFIYLYVTQLGKSEATASKRIRLWTEQYKILGKFKGHYYIK